MKSEKIDPKLLAEMERLERAGQTHQRLVVVIEHVTAAGAETGPSDVGGLKESVRPLQQRVRNRLTEVGAEQVKEMLLAAAFVGHLTPAQIRTIAADLDVKRIFWNVPEKVTL